VEYLVSATLEKFGSLDVIVNNAGIGGLGGILDATNESWDKTIAINLSGVFYGARAAAKVMKERGVKGSIINMSSILGKVGLPSAVCYCASKGGVVQLTHAAALDVAPYGIRVNAIAPGFITTAMTKDVLENDSFNQMVLANTPMGHVGEVADIATAAVYLGSDESKYVTGEVLYVDGGWTAK
jgi:NAD(P)-dependent dehydrogenase (short-subunit alcohol dehydrogenase family)